MDYLKDTHFKIKRKQTTMSQNKAILKHIVTQEEIEQYAGMELFFQVGQEIDVHVPVPPVAIPAEPETQAFSAGAEEGTTTPDGYVGSTPGRGRG